MFSFYNMQAQIKQNKKYVCFTIMPIQWKGNKWFFIVLSLFLWSVHSEVGIFVILRTKTCFRKVTLSETKEVSLNGWVPLLLVNCWLCANIFTLLIHFLGSMPGRVKMFQEILKPTFAEINLVFEFLCIKMSGRFRRNLLWWCLENKEPRQY